MKSKTRKKLIVRNIDRANCASTRLLSFFEKSKLIEVLMQQQYELKQNTVSGWFTFKLNKDNNKIIEVVGTVLESGKYVILPKIQRFYVGDECPYGLYVPELSFFKEKKKVKILKVGESILKTPFVKMPIFSYTTDVGVIDDILYIDVIDGKYILSGLIGSNQNFI